MSEKSASGTSDEMSNNDSSSQSTDKEHEGRYLCISGMRLESLARWNCGVTLLGPANGCVIKKI